MADSSVSNAVRRAAHRSSSASRKDSSPTRAATASVVPRESRAPSVSCTTNAAPSRPRLAWRTSRSRVERRLASQAAGVGVAAHKLRPVAENGSIAATSSGKRPKATSRAWFFSAVIRCVAR